MRCCITVAHLGGSAAVTHTSRQTFERAARTVTVRAMGIKYHIYLIQANECFLPKGILIVYVVYTFDCIFVHS